MIAFLPLGGKLAAVALAVVTAVDHSVLILQGDLERRLDEIESELVRLAEPQKWRG
jgi:hypothetical protein